MSAPERVALLPQVPTIAENGVPEFHLALWLGIAAPAATPPDVVRRLGEAVRAVTELPDVQKRMSELGYDLAFRSADEFGHLIVSEHERYGALIRAAGIEPQ